VSDGGVERALIDEIADLAGSPGDGLSEDCGIEVADSGDETGSSGESRFGCAESDEEKSQGPGWLEITYFKRPK
jgi:hypothetical protein